MKTALLFVCVSAWLTLGATHSYAEPTEVRPAALNTETATMPNNHADTPQPGVEFLTLEINGRSYPYAVYRSRHLAQDQAAPMIVFLHGLGECGTDGTRQLAVGLGPAVMLDSARWPAVILFPQKPDGNSAWEDHADAVLAMMDATIETHRVNPKRVALTGMSQGGHGTLVIGARHADRFSAIAPICGYVGWKTFDRSSGEWKPDWITDSTDKAVLEIAEGLASMPVWAIHGDADNVVPISQSVLALDAIRAHSSNPDQVRLTTLPGVNHNAWDPAYQRHPLAEWLLKDRSQR